MEFNLNDCKNDTARSNLIRERINDVIRNALINEFGADNVAAIDEDFYTEDGAKFSKNTVITKVADITNRDGFTVDILVECGTKVRTWNTSGKRIAVSFADVLDHFEEKEKENEGG